MKSILKHYLIDTFSLYIISTFASGMVFEQGLKTVLIAGIGLMIASLIIKPIINILLLPINLITFGLFKWASSVVALYLVTLIIPGFKIIGFSYPGLFTNLFEIPAIHLT